MEGLVIAGPFFASQERVKAGMSQLGAQSSDAPLINSMLFELRQQTAEQHQQLERELEIEAQLRDLQSYRRLLEAFYGWWKPWENQVARYCSPELLHFFEPRRKAQSLEADLGFLGLSATEIEAIPLAQVAVFRSDAQLLGSMYVTEGSTLGGQIISRMIEPQLGLRDGRGYSFYRSYGTSVGSMWREFGDFFNAKLQPEDLPSAVESAKQTFEGIRKWLNARP